MSISVQTVKRNRALIIMSAKPQYISVQFKFREYSLQYHSMCQKNLKLQGETSYHPEISYLEKMEDPTTPQSVY